MKPNDPFKCPVCASHYFGPIFEGGQHVGRYCKGWPSGHDRSYVPCRGKHEERFAGVQDVPPGVTPAAKAPQSWTNERCRHHQCDEADQHDQKCSDWKNEQQRRRRESAAFDAWWVSSGHAADPHYNLTIENCARAAWHARARGVKEDGNG